MAYEEEIDYTARQFQNLVDAVIDEGGLLLDEICSYREYDLTGPHKPTIDGTVIISGCGHTSRFEVPYEGEDGQPHPHVMCAICDHMGHMPRYARTRVA